MPVNANGSTTTFRVENAPAMEITSRRKALSASTAWEHVLCEGSSPGQMRPTWKLRRSGTTAQMPKQVPAYAERSDRRFGAWDASSNLADIPRG